MLLDVIYSVCFNICLLVVLAFMMTKMDFVQRLLLNEEGGSEEGRGESVWQRLWEKVLLGVIFGVFCIISDYIGIQVTGALPNARVIGVLSAGFLGGPVSGFITTAIAAAHRYLIFPERISTVACVLRGHPWDHRYLYRLEEEGKPPVLEYISAWSHVHFRDDPYCSDPAAHPTV